DLDEQHAAAPPGRRSHRPMQSDSIGVAAARRIGGALAKLGDELGRLCCSGALPFRQAMPPTI
ncbi:hypothetical protein, partial [Bosea sp. (in: a-proteobacteria)]|uniref:hypothetical protein n=1 Tax=Bosea sp. (in: a-proteobacteria) TaxID=1871050 RepID=UPI0031FEF70A